MNVTSNFYFGYGSLVNRATRPADEFSTPVRLHGWHRSWTHRVRHLELGRGSCSLSVTDLDSGGSPEIAATAIDGVLVPISEEDLPTLDARESGYDRVALPREQFELLHGAKLDMSGDAEFFLYRSNADHEGSASDAHPILQSYVDCVMAGYLKYYGEQGLREFVASTDGWYGQILNDRTTPLYVRAQSIDAALLHRFDNMLEPYCNAA